MTFHLVVKTFIGQTNIIDEGKEKCSSTNGYKCLDDPFTVDMLACEIARRMKQSVLSNEEYERSLF